MVKDKENVVSESIEEDVKQMLKSVKMMQKKKVHMLCPECGLDRMDAEDPTRNALSRRADVYVCDNCGMIEALEDAIGSPYPVTQWMIMKWFLV